MLRLSIWIGLLKRKKALHITGNKVIKVSLQKNKLTMQVIYIKMQLRNYLMQRLQRVRLENKRDKEGIVIDLFRTLEASRRKNNI